MARQRAHTLTWTLIYFRGRDGVQQPIGQVHVGDDTGLEGLEVEVLPEVLETMSRRAKRWRVMFVDDTAESWEPLWGRPEAAERYLKAVCAWVRVCGAGRIGQVEALGLLHEHTTEVICRALLGREAEVVAPDLPDLARALARFEGAGERPGRIGGCS